MPTLGSSWVTVDLDALAHNLRQLQTLTKSTLCAVVKADAYGHGAPATCLFLAGRGVANFAVSDLREALELRGNGITSPVLMLTPCLPAEAGALVRWRLTGTISNHRSLVALEQEARKQGKIVPVHLKVDTGMGRLGVHWHQARELALKIAASSHLALQGVFTHFALADRNDRFTLLQLNRLMEVKTELAKAGLNNLIWHCANSSAFLAQPQTHLDMVRIGTALYGQSLRPVPAGIDLRDTWSLWSRVIEVKKIPPGVGIGYGHTFRTKRETTIGILRIGYADGLGLAPSRRSHLQHIKYSLASLLKNSDEAIIDNRTYPIIGKIAMGMSCIDITDHPDPSSLVFQPVKIITRRVTISPRIPRLYQARGRPLLAWMNGQFFQPSAALDGPLRRIDVLRAKQLLS